MCVHPCVCAHAHVCVSVASITSEMVSTHKRFKFYRVFKKQKTDGVDALLGTGSAPPGVTGTRHFPRSPWRELGSWVARLQGGPSPECLHDTPRWPLCPGKLHQRCPQTPSRPFAAPGTHGGLTRAWAQRLSSAALCWCLREQQGAASFPGGVTGRWGWPGLRPVWDCSGPRVPCSGHAP